MSVAMRLCQASGKRIARVRAAAAANAAALPQLGPFVRIETSLELDRRVQRSANVDLERPAPEARSALASLAGHARRTGR